MICKYTNVVKKQGIQLMILFVVELFANVKYFSFLYQTIIRAILISDVVYFILEWNEKKS